MHSGNAVDSIAGVIEGGVITVFAGHDQLGIEIEKCSIIVRPDVYFTVIEIDQQSFIVGKTPHQSGRNLEDITFEARGSHPHAPGR